MALCVFFLASRHKCTRARLRKRRANWDISI